MKVTYPPGVEAFRAEVRAWLHEHLPPGWFDDSFQLDAESRRQFLESWNRCLYEDGWICAQIAEVQERYFRDGEWLDAETWGAQPFYRQVGWNLARLFAPLL